MVQLLIWANIHIKPLSIATSATEYKRNINETYKAFYNKENGGLRGRKRRFINKNSTVSNSAFNALITKQQSVDNGASTLWCFMLQL